MIHGIRLSEHVLFSGFFSSRFPLVFLMLLKGFLQTLSIMSSSLSVTSYYPGFAFADGRVAGLPFSFLHAIGGIGLRQFFPIPLRTSLWYSAKRPELHDSAFSTDVSLQLTPGWIDALLSSLQLPFRHANEW
jgi:hypothetical protein